jgi:hypothetical protein
MKAKLGVHYKAVRSDLSHERTTEVLSALNRREILRVLENNPIESITIQRSGIKGRLGEYAWQDKTIIVNSARKPGVHFGEDFRAGESGNMSAATRDRMESMRRSLLQETGHHMENSIPGARAMIREAFANPAKRPIAEYAGSAADEYFAESFVAFMLEPEVLADYDPVGSTMVQQALNLVWKHK